MFRLHRWSWTVVLTMSFAVVAVGWGARGLAPAAPAAARIASGNADPLHIDLPDDASFHTTLDLKADRSPLHQVVDELREKHGLAVRLAPNLPGRASRLTLRMEGVPVETALRGIALCLGDGYRWRRVGEALFLTRVASGGRWTRGLSPEEAADVRQALVALGLLSPGENPRPYSGVTSRANKPASNAYRRAAQQLGLAIERALPAELAQQAATARGLPVSALPRALQEEAYALVTTHRAAFRSEGMRFSTARLLTNPVVAGRAPTLLGLERRQNHWSLRYTLPGGGSTGLPLTSRGDRGGRTWPPALLRLRGRLRGG